jgi:hypothetical protein
VLRAASGLLDFGQPIAVMLIGILHLIPDADDPAGIVARLIAALPDGSWHGPAVTGVVQYHQWHPGEPARDAEGEVAAYCGLGRKLKGTIFLSNGP